MTFMEVSAKDSSNINSLFDELGHQVYDQIKDQIKNPDQNNRISITPG